jgi:hypothetical protein
MSAIRAGTIEKVKPEVKPYNIRNIITEAFLCSKASTVLGNQKAKLATAPKSGE